MNVEIIRQYGHAQTLGNLLVDGHNFCHTMELPWRNNMRSISCIPEGVYSVIKQPPKIDRPYPYFRFVEVPGRSGILIHKITYVTGLKGCIGVGFGLADLNSDGLPDIVRSGEALSKLIELMPDRFNVTIKKG